MKMQFNLLHSHKMKKLSILLAFLLFGAGLRAQQTTLTEAVDFTVTDCHGQTYNLFEILDRGQAVFIDFFFYTCGQCQVISPYITGSYTQMGCNMHDVFYIEISYIDSDATCQQWANENGVEFPPSARTAAATRCSTCMASKPAPRSSSSCPTAASPSKDCWTSILSRLRTW